MMKKKVKNQSKSKVTTANDFTKEKIVILLSLFLFAFGVGLIVDGKKIYSQQLKVSQRVNYKSTLNPYRVN